MSDFGLETQLLNVTLKLRQSVISENVLFPGRLIINKLSQCDPANGILQQPHVSYQKVLTPEEAGSQDEGITRCLHGAHGALLVLN